MGHQVVATLGDSLVRRAAPAFAEEVYGLTGVGQEAADIRDIHTNAADRVCRWGELPANDQVTHQLRLMRRNPAAARARTWRAVCAALLRPGDVAMMPGPARTVFRCVKRCSATRCSSCSASSMANDATVVRWRSSSISRITWFCAGVMVRKRESRRTRYRWRYRGSVKMG